MLIEKWEIKNNKVIITAMGKEFIFNPKIFIIVEEMLNNEIEGELIDRNSRSILYVNYGKSFIEVDDYPGGIPTTWENVIPIEKIEDIAYEVRKIEEKRVEEVFDEIQIRKSL